MDVTGLKSRSGGIPRFDLTAPLKPLHSKTSNLAVVAFRVLTIILSSVEIDTVSSNLAVVAFRVLTREVLEETGFEPVLKSRSGGIPRFDPTNQPRQPTNLANLKSRSGGIPRFDEATNLANQPTNQPQISQWWHSAF